jgi:uncharacterized delta-60 repeat protein
MRPSLARAAVEVLESRRLLSAGDLDLTFGTGGTTTVGYSGPADDSARAVVVLPDGKLLVAGESTAADSVPTFSRYLVSGQLDTTFGTGGHVRRSGVNTGAVLKLVLNTDGTFLALSGTNAAAGLAPVTRYTAQGAVDPTWVGPGTSITTRSLDLVGLGGGGSLLLTTNTLAKLTPNGTLDTTFGGGTGKVVFGQEANFIRFNPAAVAVQSDGKIVVAGERQGLTSGAREPAVRRFNVDGTLDTTFASAGQQLFLLPAGATAPALRAITIQASDQKIILAGTNGTDAMAIRLPANGGADQAFGLNGVRYYNLGGSADSFNTIAIQTDGKYVFGGLTDYPIGTGSLPRPVVARVTSGGSIDTTYAGDGAQELIFPAGPNLWGFTSQVVLDSSGRAVIVGQVTESANKTNDQFIARLHTSGQLDGTFSFDGKATADFEGPQYLYGPYASVGPDGSIVMGGTTRITAGGAILAKLRPDGMPDFLFGTGNGSDGVRDYDFGGRNHFVWDTTVQDDGKIVAVGRIDRFDFATSWDYDAFVARFNADGSLDNTFGGNGYVLANLGDDFEQFVQVVIQNDGKIVTRGVYRSTVSGDQPQMVARYLPDGTPDPDFGGGDGKVDVAPPFADVSYGDMLVTRAGTILLSGLVDFDADRFLQQLNADGTPDTSFGMEDGVADGIVLLDAGAGEGLLGVAQDPLTNELLVVGTVELSSSSQDVTLTKLTSDGALVTAYGVGGTARSNFALPAYQFFRMAWAPDGKVLLGGHYQPGASDTKDVMIARLMPDGTRDDSFGGGDGIATVDFGRSDDHAGFVLRPGGAILVFTDTDSFLNGPTLFGAARLQGDPPGTINGGIFHDFDADGIVDPGEFPVAGVMIYADLDDDGVRDVEEPSGLTDANGFYSISAPPGTYHVRAAEEGGWLPTTTETVLVQSGQITSPPPLGARYNYASIFGHVFIDANGNGAEDAGEKGAQEQTVFIDTNDNGVRDNGEVRALTDTAGNYRFQRVAAGTYRIRLQPFTNWIQTLPASNGARVVSVSLGDESGPHTFGTRDVSATVSGVIWNDLDGDGVRDIAPVGGEPGLTGRIAYIDLNNSGTLDQTSEPIASTNASGVFTIINVPAGTYAVRQVLPTGWRQTAPSPGSAITVTLTPAEQETGLSFGTTNLPQPGYIAGGIFDDLDGDGVHDANETTFLVGRTVWLDTNDNGLLDTGERSDVLSSTDDNYFFDNVAPGTYVVRATVPSGWRQTNPANNAAFVINVTAGSSNVRYFLQARALGVIDGVVFYDSNADGAIAGDPREQGRTVFIDADNDGIFDTGESATITDSIGHYQFQVPAGTYAIRLKPQADLVQTLPANNAAVTVTAVENQARNAPNMAMYLAVPVSGVVFNDTNGNGTRESGEAAIAGRRVYIDRDGSNTYDAGEITAVSDASGNYTLQAPGSAVHFVRQEIPAGWAQTAPLNPQITVGSAPLTINFGSRLNPQLPFNAAPFVIGDTPVTIEAEHYDRGGEGVAYHDTDTSNGGGEIRTGEGVDLKLVSGNNYRINNTFAGEWFEYTIDVTRGDDYDIEYRVGSKGSNGRFRVERFDPITGGWTNEIGGGVIPNTGSNSSWVTLKHTKFLPAGLHVWRFTIEQDSTYGSAGNFDWFRITNANTQEPPPPPPPGDTVTVDNTIAAYVRGGASANTNFGNDAQLVVKTSGSEGNRREAYLKFDISALPADPSDVADVKLRLSGRLSTSGGDGVNVAAFGASNTSWGETAITWNTKPATGGSALATRTIAGTTTAWYEWDITSYVKAARQNGQSSVTLVLRATNTTDAQALFNSDDAAGDRPQLVATTAGGTTMPPQQALVVSHAQSGASVPENGFEPVTVALATAPASNVVVTITKQGGGDADLTADKTTLTFTPANWDVPQPVNLSAANDADSVNGQAIFSFASSGLATVTVTAAEADDDGVVNEPTTYLADAATYVRGGTSAGLNFGADTDLIVKKASSNSTRETYIRFDLSTASAVTSATLRLNARLSDSTSASVLTQIFSASNTSWTETGLTWNNKPAADATVRGSVNVVGTSAQWYEIDLTSFIQSEIAAGRKVITLVLKNPNTTEAQTVILSDETVNGPQLVVE